MGKTTWQRPYVRCLKPEEMKPIIAIAFFLVGLGNARSEHVTFINAHVNTVQIRFWEGNSSGYQHGYFQIPPQTSVEFSLPPSSYYITIWDMVTSGSSSGTGFVLGADEWAVMSNDKNSSTTYLWTRGPAVGGGGGGSAEEDLALSAELFGYGFLLGTLFELTALMYRTWKKSAETAMLSD